jgi:hypothetical protein
MMLYYEENKCFCTTNARKFNGQKRLLQKNSKEQFARKMSAGRDQQIKTDYTENKILYFFSNNFIIVSYIVLFLFDLLFHYFFKYF